MNSPNVVVVDDHLLRDILTNQPAPELADHISEAEVYTTNLWYLRLCRSASDCVALKHL